jgi:hypothetical protein
MRNPAIDMCSQVCVLGLKRGGGIKFDAVVFAVVVTVTVTLSAVSALELMTYMFRGSVVTMEQLAFGAVVAQEKYTKPVPGVSPGANVLLLLVTAPAFTVIDGGVPITGALTAAAG